jgi:hypothetical protein
VGECSRIRGPEPRQIFLQGLRSIEQRAQAQEKAAPPRGSAAEPFDCRAYVAELIFWTFM